MHWIFGYGSLIWRPDFPYAQARRAAVRGFRRRFWQASPDHRGLPHAPGRVVTLIADADAVCHGVAFAAHADHYAAIVSMLDEREKNGYEAHTVALEFDDGSRADALTYIAGPHNPSFVGPAPLAAVAAQIARAHGPSGSNREYLARLAAALAGLGIDDEEVSLLHQAVAALGAPARSGTIAP
ncbi:MAG: gamma-glutamylcyclotransferase [Gammaproteobacteria bacterium]